MDRKRERVRWTRALWCSLATLTLLAGGVLPVPTAAAESVHWGGGALRLRMSSWPAVPLVTEAPDRVDWSVGTTSSLTAVWQRGAEAAAGTTAAVSGSLGTRRENTLGGTGSASLTVTIPASATSREFTATLTGEYRRTQTLFQIELSGTGSDTTGEVVPLRLTGSGPWRPTTGDGAVERIRAAEAVLEVALIFPGNIPPPPGPKAASALDFAGTASLPNFPCPAPSPGELPCAGTFTGQTDAFFAGDNANGIWALNLAGPIAASFNYADLIEPGVACSEGVAAGLGSVSAGQDGVLGVWTNRAELPLLVRGAELTFGFTWRRVGVTAVLTLNNVSLTIRVHGMSGSKWVQVIAPDSSTAPAVAVFVPALTEAHLHACETATTGPPITAAVNGAGTIGGY